MKASGSALILFFFITLWASVSVAQPGIGDEEIREFPINSALLYLILGAFGLGIKKLMNLRKKR